MRNKLTTINDKCTFFESVKEMLPNHTAEQAINILKHKDEACRYGCSKFEDCTRILDVIANFEEILRQENEKNGGNILTEKLKKVLPQESKNLEGYYAYLYLDEEREIYEKRRAEFHLLPAENPPIHICEEKESS
jgi:hypothetical protein